MRKFVSFKRATNLSLAIFGLFIMFHLAIIIGIVIFNYVPIDFLWGGRMETRNQLLGFEFISLIVMAFCILIVLIHSERIRIPKLKNVVQIALWILFAMFVLNTLGNIIAKTMFEKFLAVVTAILSILCLRLALEKNQK
ncbi:MAG: hypothetical protein JJE09_08520 [Bacteroidia bacterium]|nr:hypothetical protein [Bacteroidia bacterium]